MTKRKEKIVKRLEFPNYETFFFALKGKRFDLLRKLRAMGKAKSYELAIQLSRPRSGVALDLKILVSAGLVEKAGHWEYSVVWDKLTSVISLKVKLIKVKLSRG